MENLLEVDNLKKYYSQKKNLFSSSKTYVKAVDGVDFVLKRGEIMGLVGESGCGKSTVGKTILQLTPATEGSISFDGQVLINKSEGKIISKKDLFKVRKKMQIVFQDPYACLDPRMTVQEIVTEGIKKYERLSVAEARERAIKLLGDCGLGKDSLLKYPHQFSGGQRQRIGIARALSLDPEFIVLDEPTAALDVSIQSQILNLLLKLKEERGLSYLFISHDMAIVKNFCDYTQVMYLGKIVEKGKSSTLFQNPLHPYTRGLLASVPSFEKGRRRVKPQLQGELPSPSNPPTGCRFHTRCPFKRDCCMSEQILQEVEPSHYVACCRAKELRNGGEEA